MYLFDCWSCLIFARFFSLLMIFAVARSLVRPLSWDLSASVPVVRFMVAFASGGVTREEEILERGTRWGPPRIKHPPGLAIS